MVRLVSPERALSRVFKLPSESQGLGPPEGGWVTCRSSFCGCPHFSALPSWLQLWEGRELLHFRHHLPKSLYPFHLFGFVVLSQSLFLLCIPSWKQKFYLPNTPQILPKILHFDNKTSHSFSFLLLRQSLH